MARASFADQLEKLVGTRTDKGTLITDSLVESVRGDEAGNLIILEDNAEQIKNAMNQAIVAALEEIGLAAERFAKTSCPVDTGRLRNSITHSLDAPNDSVVVGTNVKYATYVELGTIRRQPHPFLRPAAENHAGFYSRILEKHLKK